MAEVPVTFVYGDKGAEITGAKIKATTKSIKEMEEAFKSAFEVMDKGSSKAGKGGGLGSLGGNLDKVGTGAQIAAGKVGALSRGITYLGAAITGIALRKFVGELTDMVDAYTELQNKISVVTEGHNQLLFVQKELFDIARDTRTGIDSVATVYSRTARSVKDLGKSQLETLKFTETLSKAVKVGGATAVEASNAMVQLSQGLASGTLRGDELRSVLEQLPVVAQLIATHLGVSTGQLRALGAAGKLTSEQVFDAIIAGTDKMDAAFAKMTPTVAQAWDVMKSKAIEASGALKPLANDLANTLLFLADNFDVVARGVESFAEVAGVLLAARAIPAAIRALEGLNLALAANPWGVAALGVAALTAALLPFADKIGDTKDSIITLRDVWDELKHKVVDGAGEMVNGMAAIFGLGPIKLYILSLEDALRRLALFADVAELFLNPKHAAEGMAQFFATGDKSGLRQNQIGMEAFIKGARGRAVDRQAKEFQDKFADTNARFNAFMEDQMPGAHPKGPAAPGKPATGKSFADLMREIQDNINVLMSGSLQIRPDGGPITLPSQMSRSQLFTASPEDMAVNKLLESTMDQLGKKQPRMTSAQVGQMEDAIRQQLGIVQAKKDQEELEKSINKELDERLKKEVELIEKEQKISIDLGEQEQKRRAQNAERMRLHDIGVANSLDPNFDTKARITELEQFRDTPGRITEQAVAAQIEITKLTEQMNPLAVAFKSVTDNMVQGFSDAIARAIVLNENIGKLLKNVMQMVAMQLISSTIQAGIGAGLKSLGGVDAATRVGGFNGEIFSTPGFATGGYTGETGGVVHPREFVLNRQATATYGRDALEGMNSGQGMPGMAPKVIINNNAAGVVVRTEPGLSRGEVRLMIEQGVAEKAPAAVAGTLNQRSSPMSKAIRRNFDVENRTV